MNQMHFEYKIEGGNFSNAGYISSEVKKILKRLNIDMSILKKIIIALYEAEVNIVAHAYRGIVKVDIDPYNIKVRLEDEGPGIKDIKLAMQEGFSTASPEVRQMGFGAGMGLSNILKNTDSLHITSEINKGTIVEFIKRLRI